MKPKKVIEAESVMACLWRIENIDFDSKSIPWIKKRIKAAMKEIPCQFTGLMGHSGGNEKNLEILGKELCNLKIILNYRQEIRDIRVLKMLSQTLQKYRSMA